MTIASELALLGLVADAGHFGMAAMADDLAFDFGLEARHTDFDAFFITDKQSVKFDGFPLFGVNLVDFDLVSLGNFVLLPAC